MTTSGVTIQADLPSEIICIKRRRLRNYRKNRDYFKYRFATKILNYDWGLDPTYLDFSFFADETFLDKFAITARNIIVTYDRNGLSTRIITYMREDLNNIELDVKSEYLSEALGEQLKQFRQSMYEGGLFQSREKYPKFFRLNNGDIARVFRTKSMFSAPDTKRAFKHPARYFLPYLIKKIFTINYEGGNPKELLIKIQNAEDLLKNIKPFLIFMPWWSKLRDLLQQIMPNAQITISLGNFEKDDEDTCANLAGIPNIMIPTNAYCQKMKYETDCLSQDHCDWVTSWMSSNKKGCFFEESLPVDAPGTFTNIDPVPATEPKPSKSMFRRLYNKLKFF